MALGGAVIFLRSFLIFLTLLMLSLDFFLIKMYNDHPTVFITRRFIIQTAVIGIMFLYYIVCLKIFLRIRRSKLHSSNDPEKPSGGAVKRNDFYFSMILSVFAAVLSMVLLYATIPSIFRHYRSAFTLSFTRNSSMGQSSISSDNLADNPKDTTACPPAYFDDPLSLMCTFDQATAIGGMSIAVIAILDAILSFTFSSR